MMYRQFLLILFTLFIFSYQRINAQVLEQKNWCASKCNVAGDERKNTNEMCKKREKPVLRRTKFKKKMRFPIRVGVVQKHNKGLQEIEPKIENTIKILNKAFQKSRIKFYIKEIEIIESDLQIQDLSTDYYSKYQQFSDENDKKDMISIYLFDYDEKFCTTTETSISCGRTSGFSYVLSEKTNNVVLSKFDLEDQKIIAHEFGHFFGLYHTFENFQFGKDGFNDTDCENTGDRICDTPPDPGTLYEVYVNYSNCEMVGYVDEQGNEYKPLIENFMSYYKPCYLKEYSFTRQQVQMIRISAESDLRRKFSR